jgi:hypothetical protein
MNIKQEIEMSSNICDSILELNDLEKSITDRIDNIKQFYCEEQKEYLEILSENINELNLHIDPKSKLYLDILKEKYGVL